MLIPVLALFFWQSPAPTPQPTTQGPAFVPVPTAPAVPEVKEDASKRVELNLLGKTDTSAGESRRNENIHFNLVDNNALKELNVRLGTTATIVQEFKPERNYFGSEFGNAPSPVLHVGPSAKSGFHGNFYLSHLNSIFSARSFFQVGGVKPARENDYGFSVGTPFARRWFVQLDMSQQKLRGSVNGNVLVPEPNERTPLSVDPLTGQVINNAATRALVARFLAAYPKVLPNRTDINERALNTNAPQIINNNNGGLRLDNRTSGKDRIFSQYQFIGQHVNAFQLVAGQNPNTDTKNHRARITWVRNWNPATVTELSGGFDRIRSLLVPEQNAVGPMVSISGLTTLGPLAGIPINRAVNMFRYGGQIRQTRGRHNWVAGFSLLRRQLNGVESDANRGVLAFGNDFGHDAITNFRLGLPTQYIVTLGDVHRGFRNWDMQYYVGDNWRVNNRLQINVALRYQPALTPTEVNGLNKIPYPCDCNNFAPQLGLAWRLGRKLGTLRAAAGLHYGEIFPVTFQQVRFSPPLSAKIVVTTPDLLNPLVSVTQSGQQPKALPNLYLLASDLRTPYSYQYNFTWEPEIGSRWRLQLGYVGSRQHKLLIMWYLNRSHQMPGIAQTTATINERRPDPNFAEKRLVVNGSRGYFDAGRATLIVPRWRGISVDASYWFSKALDLGASYTNTAYDQDSRISRSQSEYETQRGMKSVSSFDQTHAILIRAAYAFPVWAKGSRLGKLWNGWNLNSVALVKSGIPFTVQTGSDGPGYGNVDGSGQDRPNLIDPSILGRTVGHPDTSTLALPRSAFSYTGPLDEFGGNLGRNTFRKGGIYNVNASLSRTFNVIAEKRLTFRAESINFFNTPQFAEPGFELTNANFGVITNTLNDGRTFRLMLQFGW